jgi:hypothetical protein
VVGAGSCRLPGSQSRHLSGADEDQFTTMGKFVYGSSVTFVEFDDRTLAHLEVVITAKLRRRESLAFTWQYSTSRVGGTTTVWLNAAVPVKFDYYGSRHPVLNREWIEALMLLANTPAGLTVVDEPKTWVGAFRKDGH